MQPLALHSLHQARGANFGELFGAEIVLRYGDVPGEYRAARERAGVFDASARPILRLVGEDRVTFLQGMVTNDVVGLATGATTYVAMLTAKGAMVADGRVWKREKDLLIDVEPGHFAKVKEFLEKYLISEDAELQDASGEWAVLSVVGPAAKDAVPEGVEVSPQPMLGAIDVLVPRETLQQTFEAIVSRGATPIGFEALEILRVEAGVPRYGADMEDSTIPLEANLERAIHYNKGCYIGQEVIARATFRGHMNRKLTGLVLDGEAPPSKTELRVGEKKIGWVTTVVRSPAHEKPIALGYVHRNHLEPGTELALASGGVARVTPLPFRKT